MASTAGSVGGGIRSETNCMHVNFSRPLILLVSSIIINFVFIDILDDLSISFLGIGFGSFLKVSQICYRGRYTTFHNAYSNAPYTLKAELHLWYILKTRWRQKTICSNCYEHLN